MKLSPEEEAFLRHWMHDEVHFQQTQGPAKRLQLEHHARPADLAVLIAARPGRAGKRRRHATG
jgi:hypothetical protein